MLTPQSASRSIITAHWRQDWAPALLIARYNADMIRRVDVTAAFFCLLAAASAPLYASPLADQVAEIFQSRCISCHEGDDAEAGLSLTSPANILAGGESGPAAISREPKKSLLLDYISGEQP